MKKLRDHRAKRATSHDNRTLGPKRSTRPDGNRGRNRLEDRYLRLNAAAVDQNRLNGLGNSVPADAFGSVPRHKPNDQSAADGHQNTEPPEMIPCRRNERGSPVAVVEQIGEEPDQ